MFADDTSPLKSGKKGEPLVQPDVERLSNWLISNGVTMNVGKCEIISIGTGVPQKPHILDKPVFYKKPIEYLGLHLDGSLRFREHIDYVVRKLKFCGLIYRIREQYTRSSLLLFYNLFVKSVISYALISYGTAAKINLMKVENAQLRILRAIFLKRYLVRTQDPDCI